MAAIDPIVRHMIVCEDVIPKANDPSSVTLVHLLAEVTATSLPFELPRLCVFTTFAGGRGIGNCRIAVTEADSGRLVFTNRRHRIIHPHDPLQAESYVFRIERCVFPRKGLYWIEFRHNGNAMLFNHL